MNTQPTNWFPLSVDFLTNPKIRSVAFEDQRHFIGILALHAAGAFPVLSYGELNDFPPHEFIDQCVAKSLNIHPKIIGAVQKRLIEAGLIDECWYPQILMPV